MRQTVYMAQKMGSRLATREILQREVSTTANTSLIVQRLTWAPVCHAFLFSRIEQPAYLLQDAFLLDAFFC